MQFSKKKKYLRGMEHTAMTDIVFILLIFFLLTSSFVVQTGVKVNLPKADQMTPLIEQDIVVTVTKGAAVIFVNEDKVARAKLFDALKQRLSKASQKLVIFKADESLPLGKLVDMMDTAKRAGARQVAIATEDK